MVRGVMACLAFALGACSSGGGSGEGGSGARLDNPICQADGTGNYVSDTTFENGTLAFDGNLATFATLSPATSAAGTIAGGGVNWLAGEVAGVAFTRPTSGTISVSIATYAGDVPRDSGQAGTMNFTATGSQVTCAGMNCLERDDMVFMGIDTLSNYDRIEASVSIANFSAPLELRELCVN